MRARPERSRRADAGGAAARGGPWARRCEGAAVKAERPQVRRRRKIACAAPRSQRRRRRAAATQRRSDAATQRRIYAAAATQSSHAVLQLHRRRRRGPCSTTWRRHRHQRQLGHVRRHRRLGRAASASQRLPDLPRGGRRDALGRYSARWRSRFWHVVDARRPARWRSYLGGLMSARMSLNIASTIVGLAHHRPGSHVGGALRDRAAARRRDRRVAGARALKSRAPPGRPPLDLLLVSYAGAADDARKARARPVPQRRLRRVARARRAAGVGVGGAPARAAAQAAVGGGRALGHRAVARRRRARARGAPGSSAPATASRWWPSTTTRATRVRCCARLEELLGFDARRPTADPRRPCARRATPTTSRRTASPPSPPPASLSSSAARRARARFADAGAGLSRGGARHR